MIHLVFTNKETRYTFYPELPVFHQNIAIHAIIGGYCVICVSNFIIMAWHSLIIYKNDSYRIFTIPLLGSTSFKHSIFRNYTNLARLAFELSTLTCTINCYCNWLHSKMVSTVAFEQTDSWIESFWLHFCHQIQWIHWQFIVEMKAYTGDNKFNSTKKLPPVRF